MKYICSVISVADINAARRFYEELFGLEVFQDYGKNVAFSCGLALQQDFDWLVGLPKEKVMAKEKGSFKEFLSAVAPEYQAFVEKLNNKLIEQGCDLVIKKAKSGYAASYQLEKKTVMNWVFRKSGVLARIYGDNAGKYEEIIASLPAEMQKKMTTSRDCKRLIDPTACSDTCVKGFVYTLNGDTHKKCRNDGMFFLLTNETAEHIARLVCAEVTVRKSAS